MTIIHNQWQRYRKPEVDNCVEGVMAGLSVSYALSSAKRIISPKIMKNAFYINRNLTSDELDSVEKAIDSTMNDSGLVKKGVRVVKATDKNREEIKSILQKELDNNFLSKFIPIRKKNRMILSDTEVLCRGRNAVHLPISKTIIIHEKESILAFFHEAGHAANVNLSKIAKVLNKCKLAKKLSIPIAIIALLKTKKAQNEEPNGIIDKTTTFVKENAGKLTFAAFLPLLIEEGIASVKGNNFAKKLLSPDLFKKVAKTNAAGFSTYVVLAMLTSLGIFAGVKVKDDLYKPE